MYFNNAEEGLINGTKFGYALRNRCLNQHKLHDKLTNLIKIKT